MAAKVPKLAIIIAGGEGTRLRPLTYEIPKPLIPIQGKPTIEHIIDEFAGYGVEHFILGIGYGSDKIISHLNKVNKKRTIEYSVEQKALGTGGAVTLAKEMILKHNTDDFLIINGDSLIDINLEEMYALHKKEKALVTLALKEHDVEGFGVVVLEGNRITKFVEKPKPSEAPSNLINIGIYIMDTKVLDMLPKQEVFSMEKDFFQTNLGKVKICGYVISGQFWPTDNMERYEKAIFGWKPSKPKR